MPSSDPTLVPFRSLTGLVCPKCQRRPEAPLDPEAPLAADAMPRCPDHGLVLVDAAHLARGGDPALLGGTIAGRFTVLGLIGTGSMGAVYRARQDAMGRDVALKIVNTGPKDVEARARFEREARATSALRSPHTVTAFDFGEVASGSWFLAMELLTGESLGDRMRRERRVPVPEALRIAREACRSLAEAHSKGIVHRDLKPDNLFLEQSASDPGAPPRCKLLDFGIAKILRDDAKVDQLETQAGTVFGTPRYMSPEQAQGGALDGRSDLYSLGVILYQMIAGVPPFVDEDAVVVMARHIKDAPPRFVDLDAGLQVPPEVDAVVRRLLSKRKEDRHADAEQLGDEIDGLVATAAASGTHPAAGRSARASRWRLLLPAGAALAAFAYWLWAWTDSAPSVPPTPVASASFSIPARAVAPEPQVAPARPRDVPSASAAVPVRTPAGPAPKVRTTLSPTRTERRYGRFD